MIVEIQDWLFEIDREATRIYTQENLEDHCTCGYCRNYYLTIDSVYPALRLFLEQFGANPEAPVDFLPVEPTLCIVSYAVSGRILRRGPKPLDLDGRLLFVQTQSQLDYELKCPQPYFVFTTDHLDLPWVLDEDMDEVISPANEPECLERMWRKLLNDAEATPMQS